MNKMLDFNGVEVFSATMAHERDTLGEKVTHWMENNEEYEIIDVETTQSSDKAFHCISILVYYNS